MEKNRKSISGYLMLPVLFVVIGIIIYGIAGLQNELFALLIPVVLFIAKGFYLVHPNESKVMELFGKYAGTVKENGFFWDNPFFVRKRISLRARNFDSERLKVNDQLGNPIMISVILVWKVLDTYRAAYEVDDYQSFVRVQTDAAVRKLAGMYPYDDFDEDGTTGNQITLRSGMDAVNEAMEKEVADRLSIAGIEVLEARIGYLAYAQEIANAMLKRQQATAVVAARAKIVEGAVGMVEMALSELSTKGIVDLDEEKKASMVTNLMVVLCSEKETTPVVNAGTLNH